jgi:hypothetical protein
MLVPQQLLHTVVFLGQRTATEVEMGGTAFFVSVPYVSEPEYRHVYLVTARHSIDHRSDLVARINRPAGMAIVTRPDAENEFDINKAGTLPLDLPDGDDPFWLTHPGPEGGEDYVDVAAVKVPDLTAVVAHAAGYGWVPMSMFFSESVLGDDPASGVGIGDEVVAIGLLTVYYGQEKNEPVMRTGNLAMTPAEPVLVRYKQGRPSRRMRLYLTELRSISGLSGSPVFVRHRSEVGAPFTQVSLLGVMIGHWDDPDANHMGFGKVVPARLIAEVINQEAEVKKREKEEREKLEAGGSAVEDSALGETEFERFEKALDEMVNTSKPQDDEKERRRGA